MSASKDPTVHDPVVFIGQLLHHYLSNGDFTQRPIERTLSRPSEETPALIPFHLNWNNGCSLGNASKWSRVLSEHKLEHKFLALPAELVYAYLYLELNHKFFTTLATTGEFDSNSLPDLLKPIELETDSERRVELLADLLAIAKTFTADVNANNYSVHVAQMSFAWNDAALPCMRKEKRNRSKRFSETGFNINESVNKFENESYSLERLISETYQWKHRYRQVATDDVLSYEEVKALALRFCTIRDAPDSQPVFSTLPIQEECLRKKQCVEPKEDVIECFLHHTFNQGVALNGTACVGKTTLLRKILDDLKDTVDENARIYKASAFGGFSGKDVEQLLALQYQLCTWGIANMHYTSIFDRGVCNNMIWRIILSLLNTNDNLIATFLKHFRLISPLAIEIMKQLPTIVIIDTNIYRNRLNMERRNEGGDFQRCKIERYVVAQNLVYGVIASICKWPLIDLADFNKYYEDEGRLMPEHVTDRVRQLVVEKIKLNIEAHGNHLPSKESLGQSSWLLDEPHRFHSKERNFRENPIDYSVAKTIEIFK